MEIYGPFLVLCVLSFIPEFARCRGLSPDREASYHPSLSNNQNPSAYESKRKTNDINWIERGQQELTASLNFQPKLKPAKNVIMFIGDGMGVSTLTAARIFKAQKDGVRVENAKLSWEEFPSTGLIKTYNTDQQTPDSAGTATAFVSGEKARSGVIGVNQKVPRGHCESVAGNEVESFLHHGMREGKWAGVVTTTRITHATPSATYAHSADRDWEDDSDMEGINTTLCWDIARQMVENENNKNIRVILGGGRRVMMPNTMSDPEYPYLNGSRLDNVDLLQKWKDIHQDMGNSFYVENKTDFDNVDVNTVDHLLGLFEPSHMKYETERMEEVVGGAWTEPSLSELVSKTIDILKRGLDGYVLLVEGGRIDHAHHDTKAYKALQDTVALAQAVETAANKTSEDDTLILVTADHSHVFTIGGYPALDNDILGLVIDQFGETTYADDKKPYLTLGYTNGPGYYDHRTDDGTLETQGLRKNLSDAETNGINYVQDTGVPFGWESHGGEDVAVYARGPMSHLFVGQHEQNYIAHAAMYASCIGWNKAMCDPIEPTEPPRCEPDVDSAHFTRASPLLWLWTVLVIFKLLK